jgi:hypothetical protein
MWNAPQYPGYYPQQNMPMPVQPIQTIQQSAQVYFIEDPHSLDSIRPSLNVMYVGINAKSKELYIKQLTNDGTVAIDKYVLAENKKEKGDLDVVLDRISELERKLTHERNSSTNNEQANAGSTEQHAGDAAG